MDAIMRQSNSNSRTARRAAAEGGALRASLTSNCSGATLRHEINDGIRLTSVSYVEPVRIVESEVLSRMVA
jgi:hypothetical protein